MPVGSNQQDILHGQRRRQREGHRGPRTRRGIQQTFLCSTVGIFPEILCREVQGEIIKGLLTASGINAQAFSQGGAREIGVSGVSEVDIVVPAGQEAEARELLAAYYAGELSEDDLQDGEPGEIE